jgi:hypothetical protein
MPRSIADIRKANGGLENLTDEDILQSTFETYKNYYPSLDAYAAEVGYSGAKRGLAGSRISAGIDQYQANLLGLGGAIARGVGATDTAAALDTRRAANESAAAYASQRARDLGGIEDWRDVTGVGSGLNYAGGLLAQSLPYAGEAIVGGLTGGLALGGTAARMGLTRAAASSAGAVAASYPSAVGDILSSQREAGGENLGAAALGGIPYAALNAVGVEGQIARGMRPILRTEGGIGRRVAMGAAEGVLGEGLGETGQEMINQYAGRMAVDPNETLFNEAANKRYLDSFVGGATLGGLFGGVGGAFSKRPEQGAIDLTQPDTSEKPVLGLTYSPLAGTPIIFPDGSVALNGEQEMLARTGIKFPATQETDLTAPAAGTLAAAETPVASTTEAQPAATEAVTPRTELRDTFGVIATPPALQLYDEVKQLATANNIELSAPALQSVWTYAAEKPMTPKRLEKAQQLLDAAIIQARKEAPSGTPVSTVQEPAGGLGVGGTVVPGTVGVAGSNAPVTGTVGGSTTTAGAAPQQTGILPNSGSQPAAAVTPPVAPAEPDILSKIFGEQDADIIRGFLMGRTSAELAAEAKANGIKGRSEQTIRNNIAGDMAVRDKWPKKIAAAKAKYGYTDAQIQEALRASQAPDADTRTQVEQELNLGRANLYGVRMEESEAAQVGLQNIVKSAGAGTSQVEGFTDLQLEIDATLEALASETDEAKLAELSKKLAEQTVKIRAVEERAKAAVRATAGRASKKDAAEAAAVKAETPKALGEEDAVQIEGAAGVPVQPETEAGQGVGGQVRSTQEPASQGQVLTESEQAAQAWDKVASGYPTAPKFADLTEEQQQDFIDFGPDNWTADDVNTELTKLAKSGLKFGKEAAPAAQPYTAKQLISEIKAFIRTDVLNRKLTVVDSVADLLSSPDKAVRAVGAAIQLQGAYGVAVDGRAFLVANRIKQGQGRAKFMHEVGGHLGLDNLLTKVQFDKLVNQIKAWAIKEDGSLETELALQAFERVQAAGTPKEDQRSELIAYFIESAMQMGIDPTGATDAKLSGPLRDWFRTLWAAFKIAVRKLGMKPETMTAQDVVNLAYGAARLEMNGVWHGTAATFRNFRNAYIGTGEGATAYGWGTYLAQRVGIAKGYWRQDVRRKGGTVEGNLMRVDTAVPDNRLFDYDKPVIKQSNYVADKLMGLLDPAADEILDRTNKDVEELTGRDLIGTGENDLGLLSTLIMEDAITLPNGQDKQFDKAIRQGNYHEAASHLLRSLGIGGIKFFDAQSRGTATQVISYDGKSYNRDQLRDLSRDAYKSQNAADIDKFSMLRHILRNGLDETKAELEQKIANQIASSTETFQDSAKRFGVSETAEQSRARAEELVAMNYESNQLKWLNANEGKISIAESPRTQNLIIFDDKDVQRVGSEAAASQQRMKFGKNAPSQGVIDRNISKLPKAAQQPARDSVNTINDWARKGLDRLVFTSDLINRAVAAGLKSADLFQSLLAKRATRVRELERVVERVADMYASIDEKDKGNGPDSVNRFIFDSTSTGKWGYDKYRDGEMGARFDALGSKTKEFVKALFEHGSTMLAAKKKAVLDYTSAEYDARIAAETDPAKKAALLKDKADDLKQFARLFQIRDGIPYAPIKRFGDHVVVAKSKEYIDAVAAKNTDLIRQLEKDPDHYHVSFTETKNEARNLAAQLENQGHFGGGTVAFKERRDIDTTLFGDSDSLKAIERLQSIAKANAQGGDKEAKAMQRMVSDMYLQALAEGSARKSEMRRRGVSGELDMLRSFAAQGRADANFVASVQYNPQVQDSLQAMMKEADEGSGDLNRKSELLNEITRRYDAFLDVKASPTISKITRLSSVYFLATSPAYYLQNLTQPWMMSVPAMAGRHDYLKASAALTQAYSQLGGVMKSARLFDQQFDFDKVPSDVRAAIQELVNRGAIDIGMETELGEFKIEGDGAFTKGWNKVDKGLRIAVQKVESINRLSTAMAAYRLELAETGDKETAINYAERILTETHGDYSAFNAPRIFNTQLGKVALQFRKFQLIQLSFYAKLLQDAGFSTKEKRAATKALVYSLGHTGLLAGAMGLPGYSAVAWAIGALFGDDDDPLDVTAELRKFIGNEDMANLIMRGAPTMAGVDISGKVGSGNMLSVMPFSKADLTTRSGMLEAAGTLLGGAPIGMAARVADGLGLMLKGDWYRGMEQVLPKGFGDAVKAYRIADQGTTRRNGDIVLPASEVNAAETIMQAIGIQPVKQSVIMERQQATVEMNQFYQDRSTKIKADYIRAIRSGESTEEARTAWMKLQEARVENGYTRQPLSELLRAPQSQAKRERQTKEGVQFNKTNKRFVEEQV